MSLGDLMLIVDGARLFTVIHLDDGYAHMHLLRTQDQEIPMRKIYGSESGNDTSASTKVS